MLSAILLFVAGFGGGALNTLAGGGSFVIFPALLWAGVPPVLANASNTYACTPGYATGALGLWSAVWRHKEKLPLYAVISLIGGWLGAELLLRVSDAQFEQVIPWLMAFAVAGFALGGRFRAWLATRTAGRSRWALAGVFGLYALLFAIAVYGGFFNAGLGIILLAFLTLAGFTDIHAMNGLKLLLATLVSIVAIIRFGMTGNIAWTEGTIALVGAAIGGFVAARLAHLAPTRLIRTLVIVYGIGLTAYFFWSVYFA